MAGRTLDEPLHDIFHRHAVALGREVQNQSMAKDRQCHGLHIVRRDVVGAVQHGVRYALERPLFVLATENPIEQEGTYPLPEAQLDRFMFNVVIDYPNAVDERRILAETTTGAERRASHVATGAELESVRTLVRDLPAASNVVDYALRLIRATRPRDETAPAPVREWVRWGVGPRAGQALLLGAKASAMLDGRTVPTPDDVTRIALPVLRHRVLVNFQAEADGVSPDDVIRKLLEAVRP